MIAFAAVAAFTLWTTPGQTSAIDSVADVNGLKLHVRCDGVRVPGAPAVVLEAGAGNSAKTWNDVFAPIATFARVCAYDRPGLGSSEQTSQPRLPDDIVATLHALLSDVRELPPYVMVGHSWGGEIVRLYAMRHPAEVVGLVLIDSSHEDQVRRFAAVAPPTPGGAAQAAAQPPREIADLETMGAALSRSPWHANIPLVVLTRTAPDDSERDPRGRIWQELQTELATRSPQAEHIVAPKSGHYVQNDDPPLVVDAVRRVFTKASAPHGPV
jgi:pimeloyl-ACP methyl ester carboxylesterase